jgi:hypothetical protein
MVGVVDICWRNDAIDKNKLKLRGRVRLRLRFSITLTIKMRDRQQILRKLAEGVAHSITPTAPAIRSDTASGLRKINGINTSIVPVKDSSILRPLTGYQYFIRSIVKQLPPRQRTRRFPFEYGAERWRILTDTQREVQLLTIYFT